MLKLIKEIAARFRRSPGKCRYCHAPATGKECDECAADRMAW